MKCSVEILLMLSVTLATKPSTCSGSPPLTGWPYSCVWNSPTALCRRFSDAFSLSKYLIVQNKDDAFYGSNMTIFYGIGHFPHIDRATGKYTYGGIPQLGNLTDHLNQVQIDVESRIPDSNYSGLAVIDFEAWRPIFEHNFDSLAIYQKASEELVQKNHPDWNSTQVKAEAKKEFEASALLYFHGTLALAISLRPGASWGYYGFPRCYGAPGNYCSPESQADNDQLFWLWQTSTALYPRIYLDDNTTDHLLFLMSTVHEAVRVATKWAHPPPFIYPYSRHTYDGKPGAFYSPEDVWLSHAVSSLLGASGVVIWGSYRSTDTNTLCDQLLNYTSSFFGPCIRNFTLWAQECGQKQCGSHGQCVSEEVPPGSMGGGEGVMRAWVRRWVGVEVGEGEGERGCVGRASVSGYRCQCYNGWSGEHCEASIEAPTQEETTTQ